MFKSRLFRTYYPHGISAGGPVYAEGVSYEAMTTYDSSRGWRSRLGRSDQGNPWSKEAYLIRGNTPYVDAWYKPGWAEYHGTIGIFPSRNGGPGPGQGLYWPSLLTASVSPYSRGATAIASCAPTSPLFDGSTAVAELVREGMPKMIGQTLKSDIRRFQSYGDEYLNYQFGWRPFINDVRNLSHAITTSDDYIRQLTRNSGRVVRRGYSFPDVTSSNRVTGDQTAINPGLGHYTLSPGSPYPMTRVIDRSLEEWFAGSFTYYVDFKGSNSYDRVRAAATRARHVYGIRISPDALWNLMPWSWAIDWETNIGDVLTNLSNFTADGLVMHYGYLMRKSVSRDCREAIVTTAAGKGYTQSHHLWGVLEHHRKERFRASPWGFGLTIESLTPRQVSILAALGISRI